MLAHYISIVVLVFCSNGDLIAQDSTRIDTTTYIHFSGYAEVYYSFDLVQPANNERPEFLYNHKRHNEVNANLLLLQAEYERDGVRGTVGLMEGTYPQYNLAHEPAMLRNIYEARIGMRLLKRRELWVDAGIFPSHIGAETAIGMENNTLTRSLVAENSPYYEAGVILSYQPNDRWMLAGLVLNGWQRIQRLSGQERPSFGTQVRFKNGEGTTLNWSTFFGLEGSDASNSSRFYNNLYAALKRPDFGMTIGFDVGVQRPQPSIWHDNDLQGWYTVVLTATQRVIRKWWVNGRVEYFLDAAAIILPYHTVIGGSIGVDHRPSARAMWRIEGRLLEPNVNVFGPTARSNVAITTALCLRF